MTINRTRFRQLANRINLSTPLGLLIAKAGGCTFTQGPAGLIFAEGYRYGFPTGAAFTIGDVICTASAPGHLAACRPEEIQHEQQHAHQWAYCLGLPFLPIYCAQMGWSWLRTGDRAAACYFEREAGLAEGNYCEVPPRPLREGIADLADIMRKAVHAHD